MDPAICTGGRFIDHEDGTVFRALDHHPPAGWQRVEVRGLPIYHGPGPLSVVAFEGVEPGGTRWLRVSLTHRDRMPTGVEVVAARNHFIGTGRPVTVESDVTRDGAFVVHLRCCLDEETARMVL